jgi:hypothetical protein
MFGNYIPHLLKYSPIIHNRFRHLEFLYCLKFSHTQLHQQSSILLPPQAKINIQA